MNRSLRTLTIVAAITVSVTMLAQAQPQGEGAVVGPTSPSAVGASAADESNLGAVQK